MRSLTAIFLPLLAAVALAAPPVQASGIASPTWSTVSRPFIACPAGDVLTTTIMHNALNNAIPWCEVVVSFQNCPLVQLPPVLGDEGYQVLPDPNTGLPVYLKKTTDIEGEADFAIRAGGSCPALSVWFFGGGQLVAKRALASPDQDGSLSVSAEDEALATTKLGTTDPTADFDGDGVVTAADIAILRTHLGHYAPGMVIPVASRSWGTLKLLYR